MEETKASPDRELPSATGIPGESNAGREILQRGIFKVGVTHVGGGLQTRLQIPDSSSHFRGTGDELIAESQIESQIRSKLKIVLQIDSHQALSQTQGHGLGLKVAEKDCRPNGACT